MRANVEEALLHIYFPEIKIFNFVYTLRGKIRSITWKGESLNCSDFEHVKKLRETLGHQVRSKLNYVNILHEISRLQIEL